MGRTNLAHPPCRRPAKPWRCISLTTWIRKWRHSAPRFPPVLTPLYLACMNTLWPMGEGTVRDIRDRLAERRPRAYTTIMTIMDRLARKGVVERHKIGRAYTN